MYQQKIKFFVWGLFVNGLAALLSFALVLPACAGDDQLYGIYTGGGFFVQVWINGPSISGWSADASGEKAEYQCPQGGKMKRLFHGITNKDKRRQKTAGGESVDVVERPDLVGFSGPRPKFTGTLWQCTDIEGFLQDCPGEEDVWEAQITEGVFDYGWRKIIIKYKQPYHKKKDDGTWNCEPDHFETKTLTLRETLASELETLKDDLAQDAKDKAEDVRENIKDKRDSLGDIEDADDEVREEFEPLDKFKDKTWIEIITEIIQGSQN